MGLPGEDVPVTCDCEQWGLQRWHQTGQAVQGKGQVTPWDIGEWRLD